LKDNKKRVESYLHPEKEGKKDVPTMGEYKAVVKKKYPDATDAQIQQMYDKQFGGK
jgi:hypothetical protein